ncbi:M35 family metallo-endopeptidase [Massilia forsythiae]|nr:M35 family metallo-endopeptidase [Massilia forsythiae]
MDWKRIPMLALVGAACAGAASAVAASSAPAAGVTVTVTPERPSLARSDAVMVTVTITNTSNATAWLLAWQTPFGAPEAPLFEITRDGQQVPYLGRQVKRAAPRAGDFIALAPGASRSARVELSALYRMNVTGAYSIRYRGGAPLSYAAPDAARLLPQAGRDAASAPPASVWIDGRLPRGLAEPGAAPPDAQSRPASDASSSPAPDAGAPGSADALSYSRCSNPQQETIAQAAQAALAMSTDAEAYTRRRALGPRYTTWFGAVDAERAAIVSRHFIAIKDAFATKPVTVDCGCNEDYYAYVYPNQPYKIYVCNAFWSAPLTGTDSKGGTLVHEMSHFTVVAGTNDWVYGQQAARALAVSNPERAIDNADSHEYFGENTPPQP